MSDNKNESFDSLDGWRKENFGSYAGGSEYDETAEAITVFSRLPKCEQERITREYEERHKNSEPTLDR